MPKRNYHIFVCGLLLYRRLSMSIPSVNAADFSRLGRPTAITPTPGVTPSSDPDGDGSSSAVSSAPSASATSVSDKAKLLNQLKQLSQSDPAAFKKVTADIATQLQAAAQQTGGSAGNAFSTLATQFQQASQTGSPSSLQPARHHHGGHHGSAAAASAAYQQGSALGASSVSNAGTQASDIISSVLSQNTSGTTGASATSNIFRPASTAQ